MPNALSDLRALSIRISSSRMVDLHQLWLDRPRDAEYESRPVFHQPLLNRSIIIKYNPKPGEPEFGLNNRLSVTKLILPLDVNNLGLGGTVSRGLPAGFCRATAKGGRLFIA